jgi:K+-transporting ATPase ATPase C chain
MKKNLQALGVLLSLTLLTGLIYPLVVTAIAKITMPSNADGNILYCHGKAVGSKLIAQKFTANKYFWPRPSAADYNASNSAASNLSPTSADLKKQYDDRKKVIQETNEGEPPQDLLFASASGLDPEISPLAAKYQVRRIAKARNLDQKGSDSLLELIDNDTQWPTFGFIGEARINVLVLNAALDNCSAPESQR